MDFTPFELQTLRLALAMCPIMQEDMHKLSLRIDQELHNRLCNRPHCEASTTTSATPNTPASNETYLVPFDAAKILLLVRKMFYHLKGNKIINVGFDKEVLVVHGVTEGTPTIHKSAMRITEDGTFEIALDEVLQK